MPEVYNQRGFLTLVSEKTVRTVEIGQFASIGRSADNTLVIQDDFASGRHARVLNKEGQFFIQDLGSRNGTYVNGAQVLHARLRHHDQVRMGQTQILFSQRLGDLELKVLNSSKNAKWQAQLNRLPAIAQSHLPVLISGPSGSGKEVVAQTLHKLSQRSSGPLININCSALSESLVESELFGHTKGSFTGATDNRKGAFNAARGGTLFLDEIGDLPINLQPKMLRALENNEIKPVGSDTSVSTDVRIIAATHKNIRQKVKSGEFREDLFYRLHVVEIRTPALSERMEDFEELLAFFAQKYRVRFDLATIKELKAYSWPGNIRELRNAVARAAALVNGHAVQPNHIPMIVDQGLPISNMDWFPRPNGLNMIQEMEKNLILELLEKNNGNQRKTARELGMAKSTLHDRIRSYSIDVKVFK
ncbi:MAG: sigma 54-interacting transcriptional regulator [Pseudobdellovibrionaceae bacterium]|nr:sigma 54-interacting transcriptional regulator [Bdellovibrionales bacterium]USN49054.1 MAG: sigma 54-interacting transcriptional regulator [Pseudobdellovibrionaceae bacterium]